MSPYESFLFRVSVSGVLILWAFLYALWVGVTMAQLLWVLSTIALILIVAASLLTVYVIYITWGDYVRPLRVQHPHQKE